MAAGIFVGCSPTETIRAAPMELAVQYLLAVDALAPPGTHPDPLSPAHAEERISRAHERILGFFDLDMTCRAPAQIAFGWTSRERAI